MESINVSETGYYGCGVQLRVRKRCMDGFRGMFDAATCEELGRRKLEAVQADLRFRLGVAEATAASGDIETIFRGIEATGGFACGCLESQLRSDDRGGNAFVGDAAVVGRTFGESAVLGTTTLSSEGSDSGIVRDLPEGGAVFVGDVLVSNGVGDMSSKGYRCDAVGRSGKVCAGEVDRRGTVPVVSRDETVFGVGIVGDSDGVSSRGKWYESNRRRKERRRSAKLASGSQVGFESSVRSGRCETVLSQASPTVVKESCSQVSDAEKETKESLARRRAAEKQSLCPSYGRALSDAEKEARDTLAMRRSAENKVARKLAEMKLASLEDEKKCREYADLKHQRVIQWTNEATAKSQQSLEKCKSIDPSSSASQYEIRQQAKALADSEAMVRSLTRSVQRAYPDDWQEEIEACRPCGTTEYEQAEAGGGY